MFILVQHNVSYDSLVIHSYFNWPQRRVPKWASAEPLWPTVLEIGNMSWKVFKAIVFI